MKQQAHTISVITDCGPVYGNADGRKAVFLGIPYGRAERFRPPVPVTWSDPLACTEYGPAATQPNYRGKKQEGQTFALMGSEDCLNLNIWTTCPEEEARLPVVVAVHGGAFQAGGNRTPQQSGEIFLGDEEMVFVSVNYRLGALGFLELGALYGEEYRGSGNCGMLDVLLALRWIHRNIGRFGGDPERITLMGISAGAKAIASLVTLPEVQHLCRRLILESGGMQSFRTVETAEKVCARFLKMLPAGTDLRTAPAEMILEKQAEFCSGDGSTCFFGPVLAAPFAEDWQLRWEQGTCFRGKAVIGCGKHEMTRLIHQPYFPENSEKIAEEMFGLNGTTASQKAEALIRARIPFSEAWEQVFSDFMYRFYSEKLAEKLEADGNDVWCYSFEYKSACHGMGYAYLMKDLDYPAPLQGADERAEAVRVSESIRKMIHAFIREDGLPEEEWPRYHGGNWMIFDEAARVEYRPKDTLDHFPARVYRL